MVGKAVLTITVNSNNIQISNFGQNSFQITNTGTKKITQVDIDVTNALYPDSVFDPFGLAGDTATKPLTINTNGNTGIVAPSNASYIGAGGSLGYEGLRLVFNENVDDGFNPGETIGFSVDMDPNSVAGTLKGPLDGGSDPDWDVGGVSGAELIGSSFTVIFDDGTTATGQLQGAGNQGGSKGIASQDSPNLPVNLTVNGLGAGGIGTYSPGGPSVIVNGPAGETARIVLTKGFIQPVDPYAQFLEDQLNELAATVFPANNAVQFQTIDIVLTGGDQDISGLFNFTNVPANFSANPALPLSLDEDKLPLGFVASVIDPTNDDLPLGPVTVPIYLEFSEEVTQENIISIVSSLDAEEPGLDGQFIVNLSEAAATDTVVNYVVNGTATGGDDYTALTGTVTIQAGALSAPIPVEVLDDLDVEADETVVVTLNAIASGDNNLILGSTNTATLNIVDDDSEAPPATTLTIEAESIADVTGYRIENKGIASGGAMLSFVGGSANETGSATLTFNGTSGTYKVILGTFDENDGAATLEVTQNGNNLIGTVVLDENPGGNAATANTKVERTVSEAVSLSNGDSITITGFENAREHARFDFIRFEDVGEQPPIAPTITTTGAVTVPENQIAILNVNATDVNGDSEGNGLTFSLTGGSDQSSFTINADTGLLSFNATPDFEDPGDANTNNVYEVDVTVTDSDNLTAVQSISVTVSDVNEGSDGPPIRLEAETAGSIVNYRTENIGVASGGQVLSFRGNSGNEVGSAIFGFNEAPGTYDIIVGAFDENDGLASFTIDINDTQVGDLLLDQELGSNLGNAQTFITETVALGVSLTSGDIITVNGFEQGAEHARLDFIELVPTF